MTSQFKKPSLPSSKKALAGVISNICERLTGVNTRFRQTEISDHFRRFTRKLPHSASTGDLPTHQLLNSHTPQLTHSLPPSPTHSMASRELFEADDSLVSLTPATASPAATALPGSPKPGGESTAVAAASPAPSSSTSATASTLCHWIDDELQPDLDLGSQPINSTYHVPPANAVGVCEELVLTPSRPLPNLQPQHQPEAMDSSPASTKRSRTTDSPAKGQRPAKMLAHQVEPTDSLDPSSEAVTTVKKAARPGAGPPGVPQLETEVRRMKEQIFNLQKEAANREEIIKQKDLAFAIQFQQMEDRFNSISDNNNRFSTGIEMMEQRLLNIMEANTTRIDTRISAAESRITSTEHQYISMNNKFERLLQESEEKLKAITLGVTNMEVDSSASRGRLPDRDIAFQVTGILTLKSYMEFPEDTDPQVIIVELMNRFNEYHAISRIILTDLKNKTRQTCDSVIVYMSSTYHKQKACAKLREFLKAAYLSAGLRGVTLRDCFDPAEQPRARALVRYGGCLREAKEIDGFRVINRQGTAVLQTYQGQEDWATRAVEDTALEPFYKTKEEREQQQQQQQQTDGAAAPPPAHNQQQKQQQSQQQPQQTQQSRGRGSNRGAATRGAARGRGGVMGGAASHGGGGNHNSNAVASHPNNIPVTQWQTVQHKKKQRKQQFQSTGAAPIPTGAAEQPQSEQQLLKPAPLSEKEREQEKERQERELQDLQRLKMLRTQYIAHKNAMAARHGAPARKDSCSSLDMSI